MFQWKFQRTDLRDFVTFTFAVIFLFFYVIHLFVN